MSRRVLAVSGVAAVAAAAVAVPAGAAGGGGKATLKAVNSQKVVINKMAADTSHFAPGTLTVRSGQTLTIRDKRVPHTFSLVRKSQLPKNARQVNNCLQGICGQFAQAHGADPNSNAPPSKLLVDVGSKGFDQPGDSVFFQGNQKVKITAKKGTVLHFMCVIHPWMQGKLVVK